MVARLDNSGGNLAAAYGRDSGSGTVFSTLEKATRLFRLGISLYVAGVLPGRSQERCQRLLFQ